MNDIQSAKRTIQKEIEALKVMENGLDDNLVKALDLIQSLKGRLIVTGMGKPGHIGCKIAATMASTGTPAFFVHPAEASHGDLGMITKDDAVLVISNSGETKELSDIILYCKRYGIPLIGLTKVPDSTVGKTCDILLKLPDAEEACPLGLAPTSSTTSMIVMGDILAVALIERRGFSKTDFYGRHPGGKLGAILLKVSDLMHKGDELPLVPEGTLMQNAIVVMSSKLLGCVGVINPKGELVGMITDGDLRRFMSDNLFSKKVDDIMTKNPRTTTPGTLVVEALNIMNDKNITQLFVLDNKKPVGIIHLHDCLRAGVA